MALITADFATIATAYYEVEVNFVLLACPRVRLLERLLEVASHAVALNPSCVLIV